MYESVLSSGGSGVGACVSGGAGLVPCIGSGSLPLGCLSANNGTQKLGANGKALIGVSLICSWGEGRPSGGISSWCWGLGWFSRGMGACSGVSIWCHLGSTMDERIFVLIKLQTNELIFV